MLKHPGYVAAIFLAGLSSFAFVACGDAGSNDGSQCEEGMQGCACFGNGTCYEGLVCNNGVCSGGSEETGDGDGDGDATGDGDGDTSGTEDGGPVIVDFGTNVTTITQGESVIFTATVTDPDGPDDIQGGSLKNGDESVTFGAFTDLGNGTFEITLSWAAIDQAIGIEFEGMQVVGFKAIFFDNSGKEGFDSASINLTCGDDYSILACDGQCVYANEDVENCGACGDACDANHPCMFGSCVAEWGACLTPNSGYATCQEYCEARGESCAPACRAHFDNIYNASEKTWELLSDCGGGGLDWNYSQSYSGCTDEDLTWAASVQCCCTIGAVWP